MLAAGTGCPALLAPSKTQVCSAQLRVNQGSVFLGTFLNNAPPVARFEFSHLHLFLKITLQPLISIHPTAGITLECQPHVALTLELNSFPHGTRLARAFHMCEGSHCMVLSRWRTQRGKRSNKNSAGGSQVPRENCTGSFLPLSPSLSI